MNSFFSMEEIQVKGRRCSKGTKQPDPYLEETWESISKRILYLCRLHNININTLAFRAGITPSTLKSILYGHSKNPGITTIRHICDGLGISLDEFFHSRLFKEW